jgi:hypothetical protein
VLAAVVSTLEEMCDNGKELIQLYSATKAAMMTGKPTSERV